MMKICMIFALVWLFFVIPVCAMHDKALEKKNPEKIALVPSGKIEVQNLAELLNTYSHINKGTQVTWQTVNPMKYTVASDTTSAENVRTVTIWRDKEKCCGKATFIVVKKISKLLGNPVQPNFVQITRAVEKTRYRRKLECCCCGTFVTTSLSGLLGAAYYVLHNRGIV